ILNLVAVALFMLIYFAMIVGAAYLLYWAIIFPIEKVNRLTLFLKIVGIAAAAMLFVFTIKFLFKRSKEEYPTRVELKPKGQAQLFAFIRKLTEETGAPFPKRVFVNEEINAMVFYNSTVLSLFFPTRKNLLIGLGLVNSLNLSEFKAVLAHEFGHFSQRSMKLGSYVYMANRIIHDMVFTRDKWDDLLARGMETDFRIMIPAAILSGFVWVIRQALILVYKGLNFLYASLSRQMEFNADLVAVSVTGSDAIIHGLSRLGSASMAMNTALEELVEAADHELYSQDVFYHQKEVWENIMPEQEEPKFGPSSIFDSDEEAIPAMYASHPPNSHRERNAKEIYVEGPKDERSPWLLFVDAAELRQEVSRRFYQLYLNTNEKTGYVSPSEVQAFIEEERAERAVGEHYLGIYDHRALSPLKIDEAAQIKARYAEELKNVSALKANLLGEDFREMARGLKEVHQNRASLIQALQQQNNKFRFKGEVYPLKEAERLFKENETVLTGYEPQLLQFDERVFAYYHELALSAGPEVMDDLMTRYRFQMQLQEIHQRFATINNEFQACLQEVMEIGQLTEDQLDTYCARLRTFLQQFNAEKQALGKLKMPLLKNLEPNINLAEFVQSETLTQPLGYDILQGEFLNAFIQTLNVAMNRLGRLYQKNLGGILQLQESMETH
ncbi:MAG: M48 family metalloprotease, partial [Bacteroidia bacterium]